MLIFFAILNTNITNFRITECKYLNKDITKKSIYNILVADYLSKNKANNNFVISEPYLGLCLKSDEDIIKSIENIKLIKEFLYVYLYSGR